MADIISRLASTYKLVLFLLASGRDEIKRRSRLIFLKVTLNQMKKSNQMKKKNAARSHPPSLAQFPVCMRSQNVEERLFSLADR